MNNTKVITKKITIKKENADETKTPQKNNLVYFIFIID